MLASPVVKVGVATLTVIAEKVFWPDSRTTTGWAASPLMTASVWAVLLVCRISPLNICLPFVAVGAPPGPPTESVAGAFGFVASAMGVVIVVPKLSRQIR